MKKRTGRTMLILASVFLFMLALNWLMPLHRDDTAVTAKFSTDQPTTMP